MISIIIGIYNQEKFLKKSLESILNQSYKNYEVIMVNDGSTDSSQQWIDSYAKSHLNWISLHKKNGGYSSAINLGLSHAKGNYVCFIEPDDFISPEYLERLVDVLENQNTVDIVYYSGITTYYEFSRRNVHSYGSYVSLSPFNIQNQPLFLCERPSLTTCLIRKSLIDQYSLKMNTNIRYFTDTILGFQLKFLARNIFVIHGYGYYYRQHPIQSIASIKDDTILKCLESIDQFLDHQPNPISKDISVIVMKHHLNHFLWNYQKNENISSFKKKNEILLEKKMGYSQTIPTNCPTFKTLF